MTNEQPHCVTLHDKRTTIFVNGAGGSKDSSEQQAKEISSYIYFTALPERSKVDAILNPPTTLKEIPAKPLQLLMDVLTGVEMISQPNDNVVRLVIFCHSHGVNVVKDALTKERITKAMQKRHPAMKDVESLERNIRHQVAVVTFGGISLIPDNFAKLVLNFHADADNMAKLSHYLRLGKQDEPESYYRIPEKPYEKLKIANNLFDSVRNFSKAAAQVAYEAGEKLPQPSQTILSSLKSSYQNDHYLDKYLVKPEMMKYIRESFGLPHHRQEGKE